MENLKQGIYIAKEKNGGPIYLVAANGRGEETWAWLYNPKLPQLESETCVEQHTKNHAVHDDYTYTEVTSSIQEAVK